MNSNNAPLKPGQISENDFLEIYKPQKNHLDNNASFGGCMYETYSPEIDYVFELSKTTKKVWTIIEGDHDTISYSAGFHYVNRLGFLVTEKEWETGTEEVMTDATPSGILVEWFGDLTNHEEMEPGWYWTDEDHPCPVAERKNFPDWSGPFTEWFAALEAACLNRSKYEN